MHFYFLVEVLLLLIIFLVGCADAAAGACAAMARPSAVKPLPRIVGVAGGGETKKGELK